MDIEVVVLIEINTNSDEWTKLRDALASRGYRFIEGSGGNQRIVIAYDDDELEFVPNDITGPAPAEPDVPTSFSRPDPDGSDDCSTSNARKPLFASFRAGQFDFTVIGVHLKSGLRPSNCTDDSFSEWVREQQALDILGEISNRQLQPGAIDGDVIIVGDYNGDLEDASLKMLRTGGFRILTEEANRSPASGSLSYRKGGFLSRLDHIAIRPLTDREWVARSTMYLRGISTMTNDEIASFRRKFSDHGPVWTEFKVNLADDD